MAGKPDAVTAPTSPEEDMVAATGADSTTDEEAPQMDEQEEATPVALKKGPWTAAEDTMLVNHVLHHGEGNWNAVQRMSGLLRCGKSCRLRWTNHLRPNLKKGSFSPQEELLIAQLHAQLGNKWARMASHLPGRTDNEIKNYWNTRCKRRQRAGLPMYPPEVQLQLATTKRCRYDDFTPLSSSPQESGSGNVLSLDAADAAGYTSARPAALDLAGQLSMGNRPVQFLVPTTFSAPSTPWATTSPFQRNARYIQLSSRSSPVSPTGAPVHPVTPELSLGGYGGLPGSDRDRFPPRSPPPGARVELPSSQLRPAMQPSPAPGGQPASATANAAAGLGDGVSQDQHNATSFEEILQGLNDAIKMDDQPAPANGSSSDANGQQEDGVSGGNESVDELKHDLDTLFGFGLMTPTTPFPTAEPDALAVVAANNSGSISQHSSDQQDHSIVDLGSSEQDWGLDGTFQWNSMSRCSRIC